MNDFITPTERLDFRRGKNMNGTNQVVNYNSAPAIWEDKVNQIKKLFCKDLTKEEFEIFIEIAKVTKLNPFLREIWAVKYGNNPAQIFIGRDGYRKSAQSDPNYDYHHVDAVYNNDEFHYDFDSAKLHHKHDFKNKGELIGAYCLVKRRNSTKPIYVYVELDEYDKKQSVWKEKKSTMIKKVAEAQCFRMAFQELFAGTYDESEDWNIKSKLQEAIEEKKQAILNEPIEVLEVKSELYDIDEMVLKIGQSDTLESLQDIYYKFDEAVRANRDLKSRTILYNAKEKKKKEIEDTIQNFIVDEKESENE